MSKKVTAIPATLNRYTATPILGAKKRRTVGYARVSSDHEDQASSYANQVEYYTNYIKSRPDYEFCGIYTDDGITATSIKKRVGFTRMVQDALDGRIDLIITKSISRFARNTVDALTTIRKLKEAGVEIFFEEQNIWTFDTTGELLITILSSLAQEEAHNISDNTTWGRRKVFADGKFNVNYKHFNGYDRGPDGGLVINHEQAENIRFIYRRFLDGQSAGAIAKELTRMGARTSGGNTKWYRNTIVGILQNEKYKGDALLQKTYTSDFITRKAIPNHGEVQQYYIEDDHEPIIDPKTWDAVQEIIRTRKKTPGRVPVRSFFGAKIICGDCGHAYTTVSQHSSTKYERVVYHCGHKYINERKCTTPFFKEEQIKEMAVQAFNRLIENRQEIVGNFTGILQRLQDTSEMENECRRLEDEMSEHARAANAATIENARHAMPQDEFMKLYTPLVEAYNKAKDRYEEITAQIAEHRSRARMLAKFLDDLQHEKEPIKEFDERLWSDLLDHVLVKSKEDIVFVFRGGVEVRI